MSIGKSQAAALAEGFLDSLGTEPGGLQPRESFTELVLMASEFVDQCQNNLNASNSNASGKLSASIVANEPIQVGTALQIDVSMNVYGQFVNRGVKGTKSGRSTGGFSFKNDKPSKAMVLSIAAWQDKARASTKNVNAKKTISQNERKNASIGAIDKAYAIARSILQHGITPTGFLDKAVVKTQGKVADRLGAALRIDVINSLS